ncbi:hypothetical protein [Pontixanthobacter aquaemixtae]|uniref:Lipoprotein n=1 Tax=Pontixanthobacter aquaemixtae TaxID=1958940 RepID=A0A844ZXI3_9SPHN|nr:hypothetical protein [Pontixanthobacter aquaemixtae]MXO91900.1 hypothetical protein [Pontixanthobacter aquaemixtae]
MKYLPVLLGISFVATACTTPYATAHDAGLAPAAKCAPISADNWAKVRNGMTLSEVEHVLGCKANHLQTNEFKTFTSDTWLFKRGSEHLASVGIRDGKVWHKRLH